MPNTVRFAEGTHATLLRHVRALRRLSHPSIATVDDIERFNGKFRLRYAPVDGQPLDRLPTPRLGDRIDIFISLSQALAHAHSAGLAHGCLSAADIVVTPQNRGVIYGFDKAVELDGPGDTTARSDVADLADIMSVTLDTPIQSLRHRLSSPSGSSDASTGLHQDLAALLRRAQSGHLGAQQFADSLAMLKLRANTMPTRRTKRLSRLKPSRFRAGQLTSLVVSFGIAGAIAVATVEAFSTPTTASGESDTTTSSVPMLECGTPSGHDVDGDGCQDDIEIQPGTIRVDSHVYELGDENDRIILGRWNCGPATAALLQVPEARVWVVDSWPEPGQSIQTRLVDEVPGAAGISAVSVGECDDLQVPTPSGPKTLDPRQ